MQHRSTAIQGDAGQVVAGNATHDGATANNQLNNVITINNGKAEQAAEPAKTITDLQRRQISAKVDEVMAASGESKLDVYRAVLTDFGIEEIRHLPRDQYKPVMAMLDRWVAEARGESVNDGVQQPAAQVVPPTIQCVGCTAVSQQLARTRRTLSIVGVIALAAVGIAGYAAWAPASASDAVVATGGAGGVCHHDGKAFSLGSVTRMGDSTFYKCVAAEGSSVAFWEPTGNSGRKRGGNS